MDDALEQAQRALQVAQQAARGGDTDKAVRLAEKSLRLRHSAEAQAFLDGLRNGHSPDARPRAASQPSPAPQQQQQPERQASDAGPSSSSRGAAQGATREQVDLVKRIIRTHDFYEILGVERGATEDDLKRAYRKLALKLHPDKCKVPHSTEAFKAVSSAYACLSDAGKRAVYDRTGRVDGGGGGGGGGGAGVSPWGGGEVDPEELFNMFFGTTRGVHFGFGPFGAFHSMQQAHRRGQGGHRPQGAHPAQAVNPLVQLLQLAPVLLFLFFSVFGGLFSAKPDYGMLRTRELPVEVLSKQAQVPYYVREREAFLRKYPEGSNKRIQVEWEVENSYRQHLERGCYEERLHQRDLRWWGQKRRAEEYATPNCDELDRRFGARYRGNAGAGYY